MEIHRRCVKYRWIQLLCHEPFFRRSVWKMEPAQGQSEGRSKQKAYGSMLNLISCGAFALMSMSLSRQLELGFDAGMFNFFLGCFLVTVMKMNFRLAPVAAIFCYLLVNFRSCSNCFLKILGREIERADVESGSNMEANRIHGRDKADDNDDGMHNKSYGYREWEFEDENEDSYHAMFKEMDEYENKNKNKDKDLYDAMFIQMDEYYEDN
ncbi:hypothetical protein L6164_020525 [Bauhinia variegata]|uniref:Uncharacterized protein n=1 Tax=Bauhinia variegata TaxID=167791 RepID=A0ACB9MWN3_BAUVA|nr:hypothetical protein L6164_020525 [Bauhinia variegata]